MHIAHKYKIYDSIKTETTKFILLSGMNLNKKYDSKNYRAVFLQFDHDLKQSLLQKNMD